MSLESSADCVEHQIQRRRMNVDSTDAPKTEKLWTLVFIAQ